MEQLSIENFKTEITKTDVKNNVDKVVKMVEDGELDALGLWVKLKAMSDVVTGTIKGIQDKAMDEHGKHGSKTVTEYGVDVQIVEPSKPKLDYEQDPEVAELTEKLKDRKKLLDDAFNMWKKDQSNELVVNGELIPVVDVKSYGANYLKSTFKK